MRRIYFVLAAGASLALASSCSVVTKVNCPDGLDRSDKDCAWHYCKRHPGDQECHELADDGFWGDAGLPWGSTDTDGSTCTACDGGVDASVGAPCTDDKDCGGDLSVCGLDGHCVQCTAQKLGACALEAPYCSGNNECVQCVEDEQCSPELPQCSAGTCKGCASSAECAARPGTPVCETTSGACRECTSTETSACTTQGKVCEAGGTSCVECNENNDCPATKPYCDGHVCEPCTGDEQCIGRSEGDAALSTCSDGACVECTVAKEGPCGANSCNPGTLRCTDTARDSRTVCQTCEADSECKAGHRCVATLFGAEPQGGHCLRIDDGSCPLPFGTPLKRGSLSAPDLSADYCGFVEDRTSCEAILGLQAGSSCNGDMECGPGSLCRKVGTQNNKCTYACEISDECPGSRPCGSFDAENVGHCGG